MSVASWWSTCFCVVLCVSLCTGNCFMVPLNLTYLHCFQHYFFEHRFNFYFLHASMIWLSCCGLPFFDLALRWGGVWCDIYKIMLDLVEHGDSYHVPSLLSNSSNPVKWSYHLGDAALASFLMNHAVFFWTKLVGVAVICHFLSLPWRLSMSSCRARVSSWLLIFLSRW